MVIDIPAHVVEDLRSVDWSGVKAAVADYATVLTVLRDTWDRETLKEIADGHLFVRDEMINDAIAHRHGRQRHGSYAHVACGRTARYRLHNEQKV